MPLRRLSILMLPLAFFTAAAPLHATYYISSNLLTNPDFASDLSGWTEENHSNFSSNWDTRNYVPDNSSGSFRGAGNSLDSPYVGDVGWQCLDVVPGDIYNFGGSARRHPDDQAESAPGYFMVAHADPGTCPGGVTYGDDNARSGNGWWVEVKPSNETWIERGTNYRIPAGVTRIRFSLAVANARCGLTCAETDNNVLAFDHVWVGRRKPELAVALEASDTTPFQGQTFPLDISVTNGRSNAARGVFVELLSAGRLELVGESCEGTVHETLVNGERRLRWTGLPTLPEEASISCRIEVRANLGTSVGNIVAAVDSSDGALAGGYAQIPIQFRGVPDLYAEVENTPFPAAGGTMVSTLRFANNGSASVLADLRALSTQNWSLASGNACTVLSEPYGDGNARGTLQLAPGQVYECSYRRNIPASFSGPVTLGVEARVATGVDLPEYDPSDDQDEDSARVVRLLVNRTQDGYDRLPGDGICEQSSGGNECSLRAAVMEANALGGRRTVELPYSVGAYQVSSTSCADDEVYCGDIDIRTPMILAGGAGPNGFRPIVQATFPTESPHRIFSVNHGGSTSTIIRDLRLVGQNLSVPSLVGDGEGDGGLIHHAAGKLILRDIELRNGRAELGNGRGGAVFSAGELTLERALVADNRARRGGGLALFVDSFAIVGLSDSEFRDNSTALVIGRNGGAISAQMPGALLGMSRISVHGNSSYLGGGLHLSDVLAATLVNATISGNEAANAGGGLFVRGGGLAIGSSTIAYNAAAPGNDSAGLGGGIFHENGAEVSLYNSILAFNTAQVRTGGNPPLVLNFPHAANCHPSLASQGYNSFSAVTQDQLCAVTAATGDHLDVSPNLAPLADNGGPTSTHALTSPGNEVDLGDPDCRALSGGSTLSIDQRGFDRPSDGDSDGTARCDKGAFEVGDGARLSVSKTGAGSGTVNSSPAGIFCGATCSAVFAAGTEVTLTAAASGGSEFIGWDGACAGAVGASCTLEVASLTEVGARFEPFSNTRELRIKLVDNEGQGSGRVQSNPPGIDCPGSCLAAFPTGTAITLSGSADAGSEFLGFYGAGCDGDVPDCALTLDTSVEVDALFDAAVSKASVQLSGSGVGRVQSDAPGIDCPGDCEQDYPITASITLQAAPAVGSVFSGWSGACSGSGACSLDMDLGPHQVTAEFALQGTQPEIFRDGFE